MCDAPTAEYTDSLLVIQHEGGSGVVLWSETPTALKEWLTAKGVWNG